MRALCVTGTPKRWFQSYLSKRAQLVELKFTSNKKIQKAQFDIADLQRGLPLGSVLGPMLFLLLTNDLPHLLAGECQIVMFADDTVTNLAIKSKERLSSSNVRDVYTKTKKYWSSKTAQLWTNKKLYRLILPSKINMGAKLVGLNHQTETKHLWVVIDSRLKWKPHYES